MDNISFASFHLNNSILKSLSQNGYVEPTEIQKNAIPRILEGNDIIACAQTGTGKSAAFCLPMLHKLDEAKSNEGFGGIRGLILAPTRELAVQIDNSLTKYGEFTSLNNLAIFGGIPRKVQIDYLSREIDILVATPGRLLDLINRDIVSLDHVSFFILDEADMMLNLGFIEDVKKIIDLLPLERQTLLFSATFSQEIENLAGQMLRDPLKIDIQKRFQPAITIAQKLYYVEKNDKWKLLLYLLKKLEVDSCFIFVKTKSDADVLSELLNSEGYLSEAIHSNRSQLERQQVLNRFMNKETTFLVATDVVARGIDIENVSYVFNIDLPLDSDSYLHRIGRTGRAGNEGVAITLCDPNDIEKIKIIEGLIKHKISVVDIHPFMNNNIHKAIFEFEYGKSKSNKKQKNKRRRN